MGSGMDSIALDDIFEKTSAVFGDNRKDLIGIVSSADSENQQNVDATNTQSTLSSNAPAGNPEGLKSRSAMKKEQRFLRRAELLKKKRVFEKERRKEKKAAARRRLVAASTSEKPYLTRKTERKIAREKLASALEQGVKVCVDMSFVNIMSPKEIGQLASQIGYMYSTNKRFEKPFCMHLTSFIKGSSLYEQVFKRCSGFENYKIKSCEESLEDLFPPEDIVYMSPDSPNILQEISPKKIYVIGGLVDGTPKIRASLLRAQAIGCQTARLPINEFMTRVTPHGYNTILTLNQVYEILLRFHESNCWEEALKACVPQRKGFKLNQELEPPTNENLSVKTETADELEKMIKSED